MKINAIGNFKTRFGNANTAQTVQNPQQKEPDTMKKPPIINSQPLVGLISPQKPIPKPTITPPPLGGLITMPPTPKLPAPNTTGPIGGLVTPPPTIEPNPNVPVTTAGLISHPQDINKEIKTLIKEESKTEDKQ